MVGVPFSYLMVMLRDFKDDSIYNRIDPGKDCLLYTSDAADE